MKLNKILTSIDRQELKPREEQMFKYCPDMMSRKIAEANVQQAFVLDTVWNYLGQYVGEADPSILCVGSYEDTAYNTLLCQRLDIVGIDPDEIDPEDRMDLKEYWTKNRNERFYIIFSTSVLEHVHNDEEFMSYFCDLLAPGGVGILTMDFNDKYKKGDPVPATVIRQYTKYDLEVRLMEVLNRYGCELVDEPDWNGEPNFLYQGH